MGSLSAMEEGSADRYFQEGEVSLQKLVPEGIEGRVPYRGPVADVVYQMVGGLRSGMGYCGVCDIAALRTETEFIRITTAACGNRIHTTSSSPGNRRTTVCKP